jgi:hypothetical protein
MTEQAQSADPLGRLVAVAEEQLQWQCAVAPPQARETIERALTTTQLRRAYELLNGEHRNIDVAKSVETSEASVNQWSSAGATWGLPTRWPERAGGATCTS